MKTLILILLVITAFTTLLLLAFQDNFYLTDKGLIMAESNLKFWSIYWAK